MSDKNNPHIPYIEDYINKKRYGGNYYDVFRRDKCKCAMCGSTENLCVHHIDGYKEDDPEHSAARCLLTLCRKCHIRIHRSGLRIPYDLLFDIGYFDVENEEEGDSIG